MCAAQSGGNSSAQILRDILDYMPPVQWRSAVNAVDKLGMPLIAAGILNTDDRKVIERRVIIPAQAILQRTMPLETDISALCTCSSTMAAARL